jgi:hypothetical protein
MTPKKLRNDPGERAVEYPTQKCTRLLKKNLSASCKNIGRQNLRILRTKKYRLRDLTHNMHPCRSVANLRNASSEGASLFSVAAQKNRRTPGLHFTARKRPARAPRKHSTAFIALLVESAMEKRKNMFVCTPGLHRADGFRVPNELRPDRCRLYVRRGPLRDPNAWLL